MHTGNHVLMRKKILTMAAVPDQQNSTPARNMTELYDRKHSISKSSHSICDTTRLDDGGVE